MKKIRFLLIIAILILSALACSFPIVTSNLETAVSVTEDAPSSQPSPNVSGEFQVFRNNGVEITLPGTYQLGDIDQDLAFLNGSSLSAGDQNLGEILLFAYDTDDFSNNQTGLFVIKNEQFGGMPLTVISPFARSLLGEEVEIIDQDRFTLAGRNTLRFLSVAENDGNQTYQTIYLFKDSGKLWILSFITTLNQSIDNLAAFDAAVASFTVISVE